MFLERYEIPLPEILWQMIQLGSSNFDAILAEKNCVFAFDNVMMLELVQLRREGNRNVQSTTKIRFLGSNRESFRHVGLFRAIPRDILWIFSNPSFVTPIIHHESNNA